jgi:hypothetical protein
MKAPLPHFSILVVGLVWFSVGIAQAPAPAKTESPRPAPVDAAVSGTAKSPPPTAPSSSEVTTRLDSIERAQRERKNQGYAIAIVSAAAGLLGVLVGGVINYRMQSARLKHELKVSQDRARLEIGDSIVQWQLKQLSLLYGPLRAMFGQSLALYRQMNVALARVDPERFRLAEGGEDIDKQEFQVRLKDAPWTRFRTVLHMSEIYGANLGVEPYFDAVVALGNRIAHIIEEHAGYALAEQSDLIRVFGQYLAHIAILNCVYEAHQAQLVTTSNAVDDSTVSDERIKPQVDESAAFPEEIHKLVDAGFKRITSDLNVWRASANI